MNSTRRREIPINRAAFAVIPANRIALDFIEDCVHDVSPLEQMDEPREAGMLPDGETGKTRGFFSSGC